MRRSLLVVLLLTLMTGPAISKERDPGYDAALKAYQAKRWAEFDKLSARFLREQPDYKYAHSLRFMIADSLRRRKRLTEAAVAYEQYLLRHPHQSLSDRCRGALIGVLNEDRRYAEALELSRQYLNKYPRAKAAARVAYEFASALEGLRRFNEAAAAYRTILGKYAEQAAYRRGVSLFRGRRFKDAQRALTAFLALYPGSSWRSSTEEYLFRCDTGFKRIENGVVLDYAGKYRTDPRFLRIWKDLRHLRAKALVRIEQVIGRKVSRSFLLRFEDAGSDRSGYFAQTRLEVVNGEPVQVVILFTEYLVTGAHDLLTTLTHELYHCVQRESLGEGHYHAPTWVREGAALYVAGQGTTRSRLLAARVGRHRKIPDPMARLVNGLGGRHAFDDYAEDVAAFEAVEERHGKKKAVELLLALLESPDIETAVREVLGETMEQFEAAAAKRAAKRLEPLVMKGRDAIIEVRGLIDRRDWAAALAALPEDPGVYAPAVSYYRALALLSTSRPKEALAEIRTVYLAKHRTHATLLEEAILLELRALKELGHPDFAAAADRAVKDLEPTSMLPTVLKLQAD